MCVPAHELLASDVEVDAEPALSLTQRQICFWFGLGLLAGIVLGPIVDILWLLRRGWSSLVYAFSQRQGTAVLIADRRVRT